MVASRAEVTFSWNLANSLAVLQALNVVMIAIQQVASPLINKNSLLAVTGVLSSEARGWQACSQGKKGSDEVQVIILERVDKVSLRTRVRSPLRFMERS